MGVGTVFLATLVGLVSGIAALSVAGPGWTALLIYSGTGIATLLTLAAIAHAQHCLRKPPRSANRPAPDGQSQQITVAWPIRH